MNEDRLKEIEKQLETASNLASKFDGEMKAIAFKFVLDNMDNNVSRKNNIITSPQIDSRIPNSEEEASIYSVISEKIGISQDLLQSLFDYKKESDELSLNLAFESDQTSDNQVNAIQIYLTIKHYGLNKNEASSNEIRQLLKSRGISNDHLPRNLKRSAGYIVVGGAKNKDKTYSITPKGWKKGAELLKERGMEYS